MHTEQGLSSTQNSTNTANNIQMGRRSKLDQLPLIIGLFILIAVFCAVFYKQSNLGILSRDTADIAQVARNISEGNGYTTRFVRTFNIPFAKLDDTAVPELNHAPLFPYIMAAVFATKSPSDQAVRWTSLFFLIITAFATYFLGKLLFDWKTGVLAAGLFTASASVLKIGISGTPWPLAALLFTLLLCSLALHHRAVLSERGGMAIIQIVISALLLALLYAVHHIFVFLALPAAFYFGVMSTRKTLCIAIFLIVFGLAISPIVYRNTVYTTSPLLGINAWDLMANTSLYPGDNFYRSVNSDVQGIGSALLFPMEHFGAFAEKLVRGSNEQVLSFLPILGLLGLPLMVVSVLYKFKQPEANSIRSFLYAVIPLMTASFALYSVDKGSMVIFASVAAIYASSYFLLLLNAKKLHPVYSQALIGGLLIITAAPALMTILWHSDTRNEITPDSSDVFFGTAGTAGAEGIIYTDVPWTAAWRTKCTCVWVPRSDDDMYTLADHGMPMQTLILTPESNNLANDEVWYVLHRVKMWREYIHDPDNGTKSILDAAGISAKNAPGADKVLERLQRAFAVSRSIAGLEPQKMDPLAPDDIEVFLKKN